MNLEQRYRTGRYDDADADWVREAVLDIMHGVNDDDPDHLLTTMPERMRTITTHNADLVAARSRLGIDRQPLAGSLLARAKACVAADPAHEAEYWEAMWLLRRPISVEHEYLRWLPFYVDALERRQAKLEQGWPAGWHAYADLWQQFNGTAASARVWHRAGWLPQDVLTAHVYAGGLFLTVAKRPTCLQPPLRSSISCHAAVARTTNRNRTTSGGTR